MSDIKKESAKQSLVLKKSAIEDIDFGVAISRRYLSYALSTIMSRSLPDVRDGLKPVHRRLLYAMLNLKLEPGNAYKKCARVVGDVIGKYHPHGDVAVYDTLTRLAQEFCLRYPLVDGQGNFGSIDGDNAAAMRYTESRMTEICTLLMVDIDQDTVDFRPTYDDTDIEPALLPARFPNLLANGSEGIAVGMATNIPPHNLYELCKALIYLIDHKDASVADVMEFIHGPDFPTGGIIIDGKNAIAQAYSTGRGSFRVRAKWTTEKCNHGSYNIIITEIPYQVQKSKLIEQIAQLFKDKKLPLINNVRDESTEEIRIVIEPKGRNYAAEVIMESLFKLTALETRIALNMNVLTSAGVPKVMNIIEVLREFIDYRQVIVTRRTNYQILKINNRLEILAALKIAYLNIDEIIRIIRDEEEPKKIMIAEFGINDIQAEAILNIKLRSLRKLEEAHINAEFAELTSQHANLTKILNDPKELWQVVKKELTSIQNKFSDKTKLGTRRTLLEEVKNVNSSVLDISAFIEKEPITIICSRMGWIRSLKGHNLDLANVKYKEGDEPGFNIETYTTDNILICSSNGKFFTLLADNIAKKGQGESLKLMIEIGNNKIVNIIPYVPQQQLLLAANIGKGFIVSSDDVIAQTKTGKQIMNLAGGAECSACLPVEGDMIAIIGTNRKLLVFKVDEVPQMKRGSGVVLQKYHNHKISDLKIFASQIISQQKNTGNIDEDNKHLAKIMTAWQAKRGSIGKAPPLNIFKNNKF